MMWLMPAAARRSRQRALSRGGAGPDGLDHQVEGQGEVLGVIGGGQRVPAAELPGVAILLTVVDGVVRYRAD
jgi:hypothetical protein